MTLATPVAVTGAHGRLGRAIVDALAVRGIEAITWSRPDYDLDDPDGADRLLRRDRPGAVIHAAAWTDVDGCAGQPDLCLRRNGTAVGELATAAASHGAALVVVSTNEVFDGERTDGRGYAEEDDVRPINAYGMSKLAGENLAREAYAGGSLAGSLWIVRTAWLFGPPGSDFPTKILGAVDRLSAGDALRVVTDEIGSPTFTRDLAQAILDLVPAAPGGTYHLAAGGRASRFEVAQAIVSGCRPGTRVEAISRREFARASNPPAWSVLDCSRAASRGVELRPWRDALDAYLGELC